MLALAAVPGEHDGAHLVGDLARPRPVLLQQHQLMAGREELLGEVVADLAAAHDDDVHQACSSAVPCGCMRVVSGGCHDPQRAGVHGQAHEAGQGLDHHVRPADDGDAHRGVRLGPDRVVDLGHDHRHRERLGRQLRGEDVAVVALGEREEPVGALDADAPQHVLVGAVGADRVAREVLGQPVEGIGLEVDDGDLVTRVREAAGQAGADPATAHDDGAHSGRPSRVRPARAASSTDSRTTRTLQGAFWNT